MKLSAAVMIVICSLLAGMTFRDRLRRRVDILGQMLDFTRGIISRIECGLVPPDKLIDGAEGEFFRLCRSNTGALGDVRAGWQKTVEQYSDIRFLEKRERTLVEELGRTLGRYDSERQTAVSRAYMHELEEMKKRAGQRLEEQGRIYMTCSVLLGMLGAILLI